MKVSIITPTLNRAKQIEACILNIQNQTYKDIEHIIIDGKSMDGTVYVLGHHQLQDGRIKFFSEKDRGIGDAVNKGWGLATGDILGWIDTGDWYELDAIQSIVEAFEQNPLADVIYGGGRMYDQNGKFLRNYITEDFDWKKTRDNVNQMHTPPSAFYRASVIRGMPPLPDSGDNGELHLRVGRAFNIHRIDKQIFNIGLQKDSVTFNNPVIVRGVYRTGYEVCMRFGGSVFAPRCRRYYIFTILDKLRLYPLAVKVAIIVRKWPVFNRLLTKLGLVTN